MLKEHMTDKELAAKIIYYFLKTNPDKKAVDFILERRSLKWRSTFVWDDTDEGWSFWIGIYDKMFDRDDDLVFDFLKENYFRQTGKFTNLNNVLCI